MNKTVCLLLVVGFMVSSSFAQMIYFKGVDGATITTGDLLENSAELGLSTNVVEVEGLVITARSGGSNQLLNANNDYFGINDLTTTNDVADAFDVGEKMIISFNKDLQINRFDFNQFSTNESITVSVGGDILEIQDLDLSNRISDYLDTNLVVYAGTEIEFYTTGSSVVGLDGIDVTLGTGDEDKDENPSFLIVLEGGTPETTGNLLDGVGHMGATTNVVEIPGLEITARSGGSNQLINANLGYFGINDLTTTNEVADAFDAGEKMIISFNKDLRINQFDFNRFSVGESITVSIGDDVLEIHDLDLSDRGSDYLDTNIIVSAHTEIEFYTTGLSVVGLDGINVTLLESAQGFDLSMVYSNGMMHVAAIFDEPANTNYILQCCDDLTSNVWTTVSGSFAANTNWIFESTNNSGFFRVIAE